MQAGYGSFTWLPTSHCALGTAQPNSGYYTAGGGSSVLYGTFSAPFGFFRATPFTLVSFDAAPAWHDNLQLTVVGSLLGAQQYSSVINLTGPFTLQSVSFYWANIDRVDISTSGGTDNPIAGPLTGP
ncbi:MAG: hypothetical protein LCH84_07680 [Gemmatimonadetes bacterium]|nr:hypothetical protein [Gemmatimonadota bacterium]